MAYVRIVWGVLIVALCSCTGMSAEPTIRFAVQRLTPPEGYSSYFPFKVTEQREVIGWGQCREYTPRGVLWANGRAQELPVAATGAQAMGFGMNNSGTIVGVGITGGSVYQPAIWEYGHLRLLPHESFGWATDVADDGTIVGSDGNEPAIWQYDIHQLLPRHPHPFGRVMAVGSNGHLVGYVLSKHHEIPARWVDGELVLLPTLGGLAGRPTDVNARGVAVGMSNLANGSPRAAMWTGQQAPVELPPLPGHDRAGAVAINDKGIVVGYAIKAGPSGRESRTAVIWMDGVPTALADLCPPGNEFSTAYGLNERGDIIAGNYATAYLLTVAEPKPR